MNPRESFVKGECKRGGTVFIRNCQAVWILLGSSGEVILEGFVQLWVVKEL